MSRNINNFTPLPGSWQRSFRTRDGYTSNNRESNEVPVFYRSRSNQATGDRTRFWEFRTPIGFNGIPDFPAAPQQIHVHNGDMGRLREIFLHQHPRTTFHTATPVAHEVKIPKSTALSKLRKVVYDPPPKRYARSVSLYYRNNAKNSFKEKEREKDEDGKRCAICLEDFKPNEEVMLTPCKHMFHEDCIVPWLTSKGQCPVCRYVICEKGRGNPSSSFNTNDINITTNLGPSNLINEELWSILRTLEEAFQLGSISY